MAVRIAALVLGFTLLLCAHVSASQIQGLIEEGTKAYYAADYKTALAAFEAALKLAGKASDKRSAGMILSAMGVLYFELGQYEKALEYDGEALAIARGIGDRRGEAEDLSNTGVVYSNLGSHGKAREAYEQALAIDRKNGDRGGEAKDLGNIGLVYFNLGQYGKALEFHEQSLAIHRQIGDRSGEAKSLSNIALVYLGLGQYEKALKHMERALAIERKTGDRQAEGVDLSGIGNLYGDLGQYEKAMGYFEQALAISRQIGDRSGEGADLSNIGVIHSKFGRHEKSLEYYQQALAIKKAVGDRDGEAVDLVNIGIAYFGLGLYEKAREALQGSLAVSLETGAPEILWKAQRGLGEVEARLEAYSEAISHYDQAIDTIESMRAGLAEEETKTTFMEKKLFVYDEFIDLLQTLHKKDPSKGYDKKALEIFERKQGRTFLEEMGRSAASNFSGLPDDVRAKEAGLADEEAKALSALAHERSRPVPSGRRELIQNFDDRLRRIKADQETLRTRIKARYPDYYALKYPRPATLSELQQTVLRPGELMLVYGVMKESTCLWVIGKEQFEFFTISTGEKGIDDEVTEFRSTILKVLKTIRDHPDEPIESITLRSIGEIEQSGRKLYDLLIPEGARETLSKAGILYIIPTGALYSLPFEALAAPGPPDKEGPHYLVQDHSIAYLSSASLLKTLREAAARKKAKAPYPFLAFANPDYSKAKRNAPSKTQAPSSTYSSSPSLSKPIRGAGAERSVKGASPRAVFANPVYSKAKRNAPSKPQGPFSSAAGNAPAAREADPVSALRTRAYLDIMGGVFLELPETEDEAREITTILDAPDQSLPLQLREAASRSNVFRLNDERKLSDYRFVLFACHGIAPDRVDPLVQPALVLSIPDPKTGREDFLTMADAFGLKLNADLVALSACNTGRGKVEKGEGVMGLTRAFMYAGTPAISVTLWSVESGSAKTLSTGLFRNIKEGKGRAEALRSIKLSMLQGEKGHLYRHPFFWAPPVLFGDGN